MILEYTTFGTTQATIVIERSRIVLYRYYCFDRFNELLSTGEERDEDTAFFYAVQSCRSYEQARPERMYDPL